MTKPHPVYIVDGSAYIYRAYHAIRPLSNRDGLPTHAIFGFTNTLLKVLRDAQAHFVAVAFDVRGPTFRNDLYASYKANRPPMPEDLAVQIPYIKEVVSAHHILCLEKSGFEADDIIASAAHALDRTGARVVVVSADKDLLQLVSGAVTLWDPMNDKVMDVTAVLDKYGVRPDQLIDLFALLGDTSDNVPGVPGIGPKTGAKLIRQFGSVASLYSRLDEVTDKKMHDKLVAFKDQVSLARNLITLRCDLDVPVSVDPYRIQPPDVEALRKLYSFLDFAKLAKTELPARAMSSDGYHLIQGRDELKRLVARCAEAELLVIDLETTSLDPLSAELVGISLCIEADNAYYVPMGHRDEAGRLCADQLPEASVLTLLGPLLANPKLPKLGHNLKYDYSVLRALDIPLAGPFVDTMVASYLLAPTRNAHGLDTLSQEVLERRLISFAEVTQGDKRPDAFAHVPLEAARDYACEDARAALLLWRQFKPQLEAKGLVELFTGMEMPLVPLLARMELTGIEVNPALLAELSKEFSLTIDTLEQRIHALAGQPFNINSTRQLGEILFEKLNLPHGRKTKTGFSTDAKVLETLAFYHELPATVIAYRNLSKLKSTYVDSLPDQIHPRTGRLHTSFNQTVTATGRLSSSNPNLQNIPIRTVEGQRIRQAFVAAPGHLFVAGDYSQIDLRVLAHYSQDPQLLAAFSSGQDVHTRTAEEIYQTMSGMVTAEMRRVAKTINFGIVYGMSAFGLAGQLHISRKEAQTFIDRYLNYYQGVRRFMESIVASARRDGFVTTLFHRRRALPDINSPNKQVREFAERTAINTPIQGTAADLIKLAMLRTEAELSRKGLGARMLLQIHDELVFEVPEEEVEATVALVKQCMESVASLDVPLSVNMSVGRNLAEV